MWSSQRRQRAVIWCEDQQALAYLRDPAIVTQGWPEAGDIVQVEVATETVEQSDLRVVTRLDYQPGRMPVAPHLPSASPPPLWMASRTDDAETQARIIACRPNRPAEPRTDAPAETAEQDSETAPPETTPPAAV